MRISDWSSDVCSSDLGGEIARVEAVEGGVELPAGRRLPGDVAARIARAAGRGRAQRLQHHAAVAAAAVELHAYVLALAGQIRRASCRGRAGQFVEVSGVPRAIQTYLTKLYLTH